MQPNLLQYYREPSAERQLFKVKLLRDYQQATSMYVLNSARLLSRNRAISYTCESIVPRISGEWVQAKYQTVSQPSGYGGRTNYLAAPLTKPSELLQLDTSERNS